MILPLPYRKTRGMSGPISYLFWAIDVSGTARVSTGAQCRIPIIASHPEHPFPAPENLRAHCAHRRLRSWTRPSIIGAPVVCVASAAPRLHEFRTETSLSERAQHARGAALVVDTTPPAISHTRQRRQTPRRRCPPRSNMPGGSTRCRLGHPGKTSTAKSLSHPSGIALAAGLLALPPCVRSIAVVRLSGGLRRWAASVVETRPRREPRRRQVQRASLRPQEGQRDKRSERRQPELDVRHLPRGDDGDERL